MPCYAHRISCCCKRPSTTSTARTVHIMSYRHIFHLGSLLPYPVIWLGVTFTCRPWESSVSWFFGWAQEKPPPFVVWRQIFCEVWLNEHGEPPLLLPLLLPLAHFELFHGGKWKLLSQSGSYYSKVLFILPSFLGVARALEGVLDLPLFVVGAGEESPPN